MTTVTLEWEVAVIEKHHLVLVDGDPLTKFEDIEDLAAAARIADPDYDSPYQRDTEIIRAKLLDELAAREVVKRPEDRTPGHIIEEVITERTIEAVVVTRDHPNWRVVDEGLNPSTGKRYAKPYVLYRGDMIARDSFGRVKRFANLRLADVAAFNLNNEE